MAIAPAFLIKHVRPFGLTGINTYFSQEFRTYLTNTLRLSQRDVATLVQSWSATALKDPADDEQAFIDTANAVSQARWAELYPTARSTIAFLDGGQLAALSESAENADRDGAAHNYVVDFSGDPIAIAVTMNRGGGSDVTTGVTGLSIGTDGAGNAVHLAGVEA